MLFITLGLMGGSCLADPCDDYGHAVDKYIQAIRESSQKLDQASDAHQFADAVNVFTSATEELTATLRELSPQVTALYQSHSNGTKFGEQAPKYISNPEVQQAFDRLRKLRFDASERGPARGPGFRASLTRQCYVSGSGRWAALLAGGCGSRGMPNGLVGGVVGF
jgi:hypothetical protein